jgi:hypothetical protein
MPIDLAERVEKKRVRGGTQKIIDYFADLAVHR